MSSRNKVFDFADFAIIRRAKTNNVKVIDVVNGVITFDVEGVEVTAAKDEKGFLKLSCICDFCRNGYALRNQEPDHPLIRIVNKILCSRQISVYWYLIKMEGRVSEIETSWKYARTKDRGRNHREDSPAK